MATVYKANVHHKQNITEIISAETRDNQLDSEHGSKNSKAGFARNYQTLPNNRPNIIVTEIIQDVLNL